MNKRKRGQVWVETVTYTLIAFILLGLVLAFVKPKIEEMRDKAIVDQSITMLKDINTIILEVGDSSVGNKRLIEVTLKKGQLNFDPVADINKNINITFEVDSRYIYSEPGVAIEDGNLDIITTQKGKYNKVDVTMSYNSDIYTLKINNVTTNSKLISKSPTPYQIFISHEADENNKKVINIEI